MGAVEELEQAARRLVEGAGGGVVRIGQGPGRGGGLVIGDGVVATNAHNLRGPETTVTFADGRTATASVAGADADADLAVLKVATSGAPVVPWAEGDADPAPGTLVFTLTTMAGGGTRVTSGAVSAAGRAFRGPGGRLVEGGFEHTAPLARGSSGSPVLDAAGRVLGICTHRLGDGFYLAIPVDASMRARLDALSSGRSPRRLRLGVALAPAVAARRMRAAVGLPERDGLLVRAVEEASPASTAGIARGDLLLAAAGRPLPTADHLFAVMEPLGPGDTLTMSVLRGADELTLEVAFPL